MNNSDVNLCVGCSNVTCCIIFDVELFPDDFLKFPDIHVEDDGLTLKFAGQRCPYLDKDNRCSIYEKRPSECMEYDCLGDARVNNYK